MNAKNLILSKLEKQFDEKFIKRINKIEEVRVYRDRNNIQTNPIEGDRIEIKFRIVGNDKSIHTTICHNISFSENEIDEMRKEGLIK